MSRIIIIYMFLFASVGYCQNNLDIETIADSMAVQLESEERDVSYFSDSIYAKDLTYDERRFLPENLNTKYSGDAFTYKEDKTTKKKETKDRTKRNQSLASGFAYFMSNIFPFLLAILVILILLRSFLDVSFSFGSVKKMKKNEVVKLVSEENDIHEADIKMLLSKAIKEKDYRLATRYYYLSLLKLLSENELIKYDKDKTNSEYLFELKDTRMRSHFSYLSYIYNYVWYGEFTVDAVKFSTIENKYKSFLKSIK